MKFDIKKFFNVFDISAYVKLFAFGLRILVIAVFVFGILWIKNLLLPEQKQVENKPTFNVQSGGNVTYVSKEDDKDIEIGAFGGSVYYDDELGYFGGIQIKKRF